MIAHEKVIKYMPLVQKYAGSICTKYDFRINIDDLTSAGYEGLLIAANKFDETVSEDFEMYVSSIIYFHILDEVKDFFRFGLNGTEARRKGILRLELTEESHPHYETDLSGIDINFILNKKNIKKEHIKMLLDYHLRDKTLTEIGKEFGWDMSYISHILKRTMKKITK